MIIRFILLIGLSPNHWEYLDWKIGYVRLQSKGFRHCWNQTNILGILHSVINVFILKISLNLLTSLYLLYNCIVFIKRNNGLTAAASILTVKSKTLSSFVLNTTKRKNARFTSIKKKIIKEKTHIPHQSADITTTHIQWCSVFLIISKSWNTYCLIPE